MSLNTTNAWPRILSVLRATMSKIGPNWENMAYSDFFISVYMWGDGGRGGEGGRKRKTQFTVHYRVSRSFRVM